MIRRLKGRPPVSDIFGVRGRRWLGELELPEDERETVAACLRHVDFLNNEVGALDRALAKHALQSPDTLRLMTIPGVSVITASTFVSAIGDIKRFASARQLVGYLGLDPRVRQSGNAPARHGRITKQGRPPSATYSSKPPGSPSAPPARFARSTNASVRAAAPKSPPWRLPANWPACAGVC